MTQSKLPENAFEKEIQVSIVLQSVSIPVTHPTKVKVTWTRGDNRVDTKTMVLAENQTTTYFKERFTRSSLMCLDKETMKPVKKKESTVVVVGDKKTGILGKAKLDLSQYGDREYKILKLRLQNAVYENSFIECHLKGVDAKDLDMVSTGSKSARSRKEKTRSPPGRTSVEQAYLEREALKKKFEQEKTQSVQKGKIEEEKLLKLEEEFEDSKTEMAQKQVFINEVKVQLDKVQSKNMSKIEKLSKHDNEIEKQQNALIEVKSEIQIAMEDRIKKKEELVNLKLRIDEEMAEYEREMSEKMRKEFGFFNIETFVCMNQFA